MEETGEGERGTETPKIVSIMRFSKRLELSSLEEESPVTLPPVKDPRLTKIYSKKVFPPWYRRYEFALPDDEKINFQPPAEVDQRNELLAMLFVWGEDWKSIIAEDPGKRYTALKKYSKHIEQLRAPSIYEYSKIRIQKTKSVISVKNLVQSYKKKTDNPNEKQLKVIISIVNYLRKIQVQKFRAVKPKKILIHHSKWRVLHMPIAKRKIKRMALNMHIEKVRKRFKRIISLVRCVQRFLVTISILSGNTKRIFHELVKFQREEKEKLDKAQKKAEEEEKNKKIMFNMKKYCIKKVLTLDVHVRFTLTKPWFERKEKEILEVMDSLQNLRSYVALPINFQRLIAKAAWYMEIPEDKVIIRECHIAQDYYLVISGRCTMCKLNGSPEEQKRAGFSFIKHCFKGDVFGDESILDPGSTRTYSVISSTACEILAINIHDYHRMLLDNSDKEDEEELEPEHIRFLYHLSFLKNFPVAKIMEEEEDGNLSVFYVAPNKIVCLSVRDSQFVYILKHGRANLMIEKKPKEEDIQKYQSLCEIWDYNKKIRLKRMGQEIPSSRSSIASDYVATVARWSNMQGEPIRNPQEYHYSVTLSDKQHIIKRLQKQDKSDEGKNQLNLTRYMKKNDKLMPFGNKDLKFKRLTEIRRMPAKKSEKALCKLRKRYAKIKDTSFSNSSITNDTILKPKSSPASARRYDLDRIRSHNASSSSDIPSEPHRFTNNDPSYIYFNSSPQSRQDRIKSRSSSCKINSTNTHKDLFNNSSTCHNQPNTRNQINNRQKKKYPTKQRDTSNYELPTSLNTRNKSDSKPQNYPERQRDTSNNDLSTSLSTRNKSNSRPQSYPERQRDTSNCKLSTSLSNRNKSNSRPQNYPERQRDTSNNELSINEEVIIHNRPPNPVESKSSSSSSTSSATPPLIKAADVANEVLHTSDDSCSTMSNLKKMKPVYKAINPSVLMTPDQWSKFLIYKSLVKGDQAGYEWLDFKDGPFDPPEQDYALVSDGCEFIMLKKEYILHKMKKKWMTEDLINEKVEKD